jgi:hypothetical protein
MEQFRGKSFCLHGSILLFSAKAENAANRLGYHAFFVRANDADRNPAGRRGNHALIRCVSLFFEFDSNWPFADFESTGGQDGMQDDE